LPVKLLAARGDALANVSIYALSRYADIPARITDPSEKNKA
jgi:hypothetical protein